MRGYYESDVFGGCPIPANHKVRTIGDSVIGEVFDSPVHVNERGHRHEVVVDKRTHRIRFENETEHEVTILVEPK